MTLISVIVPFLNEEPYIEKCIRSLLDQDFDKDKYELIFIDNGSTDRSAEIVRGFPNIIILEESIKCPYAARNKGLSVAKGQIFAFTDADCVVSYNWLTQIYEGITKLSAAILLGKRFFSIGSSAALKMFEDYENAKVEYVLNMCHKKYFYGFTNNMAVRQDVLKETGLFSVSVSAPAMSDTELIQKWISRHPDTKIIYLPRMEITHLEIKDMKTWLGKMHIYGKYNMLVKAATSYAPIDNKTKLQVYTYCFKKNDYKLTQKIILFLLLILGYLYYESGAIEGHLKSISSGNVN